ncbi:MAG: hypothetical protein GX417_12475 [Clostridiales bacterium]|nr:hypothetical protein [Clostridiales bacterium]
MWKCPNCEANNADDQKRCVACNGEKPEHPVRFRTLSEHDDSYSAANQNPSGPSFPEHLFSDKVSKVSKVKRQDGIFRVFQILVVVAAVVVILVVLLERGKPPKASEPTNQGVQVIEEKRLDDFAETPTLEAGGTAGVTAEPKETEVPVVSPPAIELHLNFREIYQCSTKDFNLPYGVDNSDVTWDCESNESGTRCLPDGTITAGNIQIDPAYPYNEPVMVTGTTPNGSKLVYSVIIGNGRAYDARWSDSSRNLKVINGDVIVISPMIQNCTGFTIYYEYDLYSGEIEHDSWSVLVRENGTEWVYIQDITLENNVGKENDIVFDRPISFSEIVVQPQVQYGEFSYTPSFALGYLVFGG